MGFVFISHASPDKLVRVKPVVRALAREGVTLWLDRPGAGEHDFQLPDEFVRRHSVQRLLGGVPWTDGIRGALKASSAVLVCLSRAAIEPGREVLRQEVAYAAISNKVVSCVVDDLDLQQVPGDWGLVRPGHLQSPLIDVAALDRALDWLEGRPGECPEALPEPAWRGAWQTVRALRDDLDAAARRGAAQAPAATTGPSPRVAELMALLGRLGPSPSQLRRLYLRSLPDAAREQPGATLGSLLADLEDSRPARLLGVSPLIEFAERLGRECDDAALLQWVLAQTAADPGALADLHEQLATEETQTTGVATLFCDIDLDEERQIRWWLHAPLPSACLAGGAVPLEERKPAALLGPVLSDALASAEAVVRKRFPMRVALLLPHSMLAMGLEGLQIEVDDGSGLGPVSEPLCARYSITLHWRKRAFAFRDDQPCAPGGQAPRPDQALDAWKEALNKLKRRLDSGGAGVLWSAAGSGALRVAAARLLHPAQPGLCIGVGPEAMAGQDVAECLRAGVPCFFWFRAPPHDIDTLRPIVCDQFARHRPSVAPHRVREHGRTLDGDPFAALSVVWDEPGHMPDIMLFESPPERS